MSLFPGETLMSGLTFAWAETFKQIFWWLIWVIWAEPRCSWLVLEVTWERLSSQQSLLKPERRSVCSYGVTELVPFLRSREEIADPTVFTWSWSTASAQLFGAGLLTHSIGPRAEEAAWGLLPIRNWCWVWLLNLGAGKRASRFPRMVYFQVHWKCPWSLGPMLSQPPELVTPARPIRKSQLAICCFLSPSVT